MKIKCKCGCGIEREQFDKRGRERFFVAGHQGKANRGKLKEVWNKGKKNIYSEETLEKMRKAKLGTHFRKGKLASELTRKNISIGKLNEWKDKKQSEVSRKIKLYAKDKAKREIPLKSSCEICNSTENLQRHHWRYDKPLLVNTLCKICHNLQHIKNFNQSKYSQQEEISCHM